MGTSEALDQTAAGNHDAADAPDPAATILFEEAKQSVVNIRGRYFEHYPQGDVEVAGSAGSGAFLKTSSDTSLPRCEVTSDNHALQSDDNLRAEFEITLNDGTKHPGTIIRRDFAHDLVFLKVENITDPEKQCKTLTLADAPPQAGEVTIRVNRTLQQAEFNVGKFLNSIKRSDAELPPLPNEDVNRQFQVYGTKQSLWHQFSGSPVLDMKGRVLGIHEAAGKTAQESLATPAAVVKEQLDDLHKH